MDRQTTRDLTISQAASLLGVSEKTVRRRIKAGMIAARQVPTPGGFEYRVDFGTAPVVDTRSETVPRGERGDADLMTLAAMDVLRSQLGERERQLRELQDERVRLAEQLGHAKAQIQQMQMQLRLLGDPRSESPAAIVAVQGRGFWARLRRTFGGR